MTCRGIVGQGTILTLSVDTIIGSVRNVQMPTWITEAVDFSGLENLDWMCFLPAGLSDPGSFTAEIFLDTTIVIPSIRVVQVATFTFPLTIGTNTTAATLSGSGFITEIGWPNAAIAEPQMQSVTFKYDGNGTPPAFTLETV